MSLEERSKLTGLRGRLPHVSLLLQQRQQLGGFQGAKLSNLVRPIRMLLRPLMDPPLGKEDNISRT